MWEYSFPYPSITSSFPFNYGFYCIRQESSHSICMINFSFQIQHLHLQHTYLQITRFVEVILVGSSQCNIWEDISRPSGPEAALACDLQGAVWKPGTAALSPEPAVEPGPQLLTPHTRSCFCAACPPSPWPLHLITLIYLLTEPP